MLGWEFPPYITGGLGRACFGLTKALDAAGHEVLFVLPRPIHESPSSIPHASLSRRTTLLAPGDAAGIAQEYATPSQPLHHASLAGQANPSDGDHPGSEEDVREVDEALGAMGSSVRRVRFLRIASTFSSPYPAFGQKPNAAVTNAAVSRLLQQVDPAAWQLDHPASPADAPSQGLTPDADGVSSRLTSFTGPSLRVGGDQGNPYGSDLIGDAYRYARLALSMTRGERFDVIHAHDWLTFPAATMLAEVTGKPFIAHIHSTEFDRAGPHANPKVVEVERAGLVAADRIITVSQLTKAIIVRRHGIGPGKIDVVYNGIDSAPVPVAHPTPGHERTVLFLGRITFQKGPEYFIRAAKRVLEVLPDVRFVLAGSGDLALRMMQEANALGIGQRVFFTGFLQPPQVQKIFELADCYVMPSVSEPFGIAALEALSHQVPVILSKTCGAGEVLDHVLKVDFWDCDDIANKIIAVLSYPALATTLAANGDRELQGLTWTVAAERCVSVYQQAAKAGGTLSHAVPT